MNCQQMSMDIDSIEGVSKLNNTKYTYKSKDLISTSYELSVTQQRVISLACKKMQPIYIEDRIAPKDLENVLGAMKFRLIKISVSEYRKEYNIKGKNIYDYLEAEINDLYNKGFNYIDVKDNDKLKKRRWVNSCDFDRKGGVIALTFNIDILLDILIFKGSFVALLFDLSQNIKSKYAFRMYEILKSKAYLGRYKIDVEEFKFMLAIVDKYDEFANLNKKVIKPNLLVINKFSDIEVKCELIRSGRNVKWLDFYISKKKCTIDVPDNNFIEKIPSAYKEISKALNKYKVVPTSNDMRKLCNLAMQVTNEKHKDMSVVEYILSKIKILDDYAKNNNVGSAIGFLIDSMKNEYSNHSIEKQSDIKSTNKFINFQHRPMYDDEIAMDSLEKKLLGWDKDE